MLDPKTQQWLSRGYAKIGDISYSIALNMRKGKNTTPSQLTLYNQGIKMYLLLDILFRHVTFDSVTNAPILWRITEKQANKFIRCLIQIGDLERSPIAPSLYPRIKPLIVGQGTPGNAGLNGINGLDANLNAVIKAGEKQLKITSSVLLGIKTFEFSIVNYIQQLFAANILGTKIFEVGTSPTITINIASTKGTENLVYIQSTDATVDAILQPLISLGSANNIAVQPYQVNLVLTAQTVTGTYTFQSNEGVNTVQVSDTVSFFYPFLFGMSASVTPSYYVALTKLVTSSGNKTLLLNGNDQYAFIGYPSSYGVLTRILDQNGFNVTSNFQSSLVNITSTGLVVNWTIEYRVYRTIIKTSIVSANYTVQF